MMQEMLASRVVLSPRPQSQSALPLEVAMLGHCPGRIRARRLLALAEALSEIRKAGFGDTVDALIADPDAAEQQSNPAFVTAANIRY